MATYKRITDVEVVEKNDNMNVLVEDAGTLKKIPASQVGGGNGIGGIFILERNGDFKPTANMTYEELNNALTNNGPIFGFCKTTRESDEGYSYDFFAEIYIDDIDSIIMIPNAEKNKGLENASYYEFYPNGNISYFEIQDDGLDDGSGVE